MTSASSSKMMEAMPKIIVALFIIVIIVVIWIFYSAKIEDTPDVVEDDSAPIEYEQTPKPDSQSYNRLRRTEDRRD